MSNPEVTAREVEVSIVHFREICSGGKIYAKELFNKETI